MSTNTPENWGSDANARTLRVELSAGHTFLLSLDQFLHAEIECPGDLQRVRAVFTTHEVMIHGYSLRRIVNALQRLELAMVAISPASKSPATDGQPVIRELAVRETPQSQTSHQEPPTS